MEHIVTSINGQNKSNKVTHMHTHGDSTADWRLGPKIDQYTLSVRMAGWAFEDPVNGAADKLSELVELMMDEKFGLHGYTSYPLSDEDEFGENFIRAAGIVIKGHVVAKIGVAPIYPYSNLPFMQIMIYSAEIARLKQEKKFKDVLGIILRPEIMNAVVEVRVSRIDFAYDIYCLASDWCWYGDRYRDGEKYTRKSTTQYFGSIKSGIRLRIYDKKAQLADKPSPIVIKHSSMMRVEVSLQRGKASPGGNVFNLMKVKNPFLSIHPIESRNIHKIIDPLKNCDEFEIFNKIGLHMYLKLQSDWCKRKYKKLLQMQEPPYWWKPEEMWSECLELLSKDPFLNLEQVCWKD